ncbi:MAG: DUF177 domain-containing protein [Myxococcales bacterium]|nr:DUF177 domain-containing protein [Myxococcales bacterium]
MTRPTFVVPLADIEREPQDREWPIDEAWLALALAETDATATGPGRLEVRVTKTGREVLVQGRATAPVTLPDARTLDPVEVVLQSEIFLMLAPGPTDVGPKRGRRERPKPAGGTTATHKKKSNKGWHDDPELSDSDAGQDSYFGEEVVLDGFVREFLLLELPMVAHKDLPTGEAPAIAPPSPAPEAEPRERVDPRLAPLAAIAERLRERKN